MPARAGACGCRERGHLCRAHPKVMGSTRTAKRGLETLLSTGKPQRALLRRRVEGQGDGNLSVPVFRRSPLPLLSAQAAAAPRPSTRDRQSRGVFNLLFRELPSLKWSYFKAGVKNTSDDLTLSVTTKPAQTLKTK